MNREIILGNFPCHWHSELEMTYVLEGEMTYMVNQTSLHLKKKDCLLVNTNSMHAGEQYQDSDCQYICFVFDPILIYQVYNRKRVLYPDIVMIPAQARQIQRLKDSLAFIYENYANNLTLDEIANSCHTSKSEFCRLFKQVLHQSPFDFLLRYRIEQRLTLLQKSDYSITEIATQVGFSGPSYYAEVFKRYMLCSPTAYRKKHLQKTSSGN